MTLYPSTFQTDIPDRVLATGGAGVGIGTRILMYDGTIKPVEQVVVGDLLMGPDSQSRMVLSTINGTDQMYRIVPVNGESWTCTSLQLLTLLDSVTGEIFDIPLNEYLGTSGECGSSNAKIFGASIDFPLAPVPIDPYLAGLWLGGSIRSAPVITSSSPAIHDYCREIAGQYGCKLIVRPYNGRNTYTLRFQTGALGQGHCATPHRISEGYQALIDDEGQKRIPPAFLRNSCNVRLSILAGLLDTAGYYANGSYKITTRNAGLKDDVLYLARSLGFATCATSMHALDFPGDGWRIMISGHLDQIPCKVKPAWFHGQRDALHTDFTVEPTQHGVYHGFTLTSDGRFLLGDFTVTQSSSMFVE